MAKKNSAEIKFSADIGDFTSGIKTMNDNIKVYNAQLKLNSTQLKGNSEDISLLQQRVSLLTSKYDASTEKVENTQKALDEAKRVFGENSEEVQKWTKNLAYAQAEQENINQELTAAKGKLETAEQALNSNATATEDLANKTKQSAEEQTEANTKYLATKEALDQIGDAAKNAADKLVDFGKSTLEARDKTDNALDTIQFGTGRTTAEMVGLETALKNIVKTIPVADMNDLGNAMATVATKCDLTDEEIEPLMMHVAQLSKISGESASSITDSMISMSIAFGTEYDRSLDIMMQASQKYGVSFNELSSMASSAGAALHDIMGLSLEQVTSLMGYFAASGVDASQAVAGLMKATKNMSEDGTASIEAFNEVLAKLSSGQMSVADAQEIFGAKAQNFIAMLQSSGVSSIDIMSKSLENQTGALSTVSGMYDEMKDSGDDMVVAQQKAQQTLSDLGESILTTLTPAISNFSDMISAINDTWNSLSPEAQNAIVTIGEIVVIIGTMIGVLSTLQKGIMAVNFVMMANPAALVIAGIVALIAILIVLWNNCEGFRNAVLGGIDMISNGIGSFGNFVANIANTIGDAFTNKWNEIKNGAANLLGGLKDGFFGAIDFIKGLFNFEFRWPHIPLPHFSISGSINPLDWLKGGLPKIGVEWYAKAMDQPYVFNQPSIIGVGEAGAEMVVGKNFVYEQVQSALSSLAFGNIFDLFSRLMSVMDRPINLYVDDNKIAEATATADDRVSASRVNLMERGLAL